MRRASSSSAGKSGPTGPAESDTGGVEPQIRPVTPEDVPAFVRAEFAPFGILPEDRDLAWACALVEPERSFTVVDAGRIVATAGAYSFELTLPGGPSLPVAGVTNVGVLPTHRRRGLLRAMMRHQLDELHGRGEPIAVLTASQSLLYSRYGYGMRPPPRPSSSRRNTAPSPPR